MEAHSQTPAPPPAESAAVEAAVKPAGPVAAVLLAAGIGALVLGIMVIWAAASESFAESIAYSDRVGPLSGKTIWAVVAFLVSWGALSVAFRRRSVDLGKVIIVAVVLLGLGYLATFAPFFELFAPEE